MSDELLVLSHPARVIPLLEAPEGRGVEIDEAIRATHNIFYFRAEISNDQLDTHFTHMSESTLRNYAADAQRGVAFLRGHNWKELPLGYSYGASMGVEGGRQRVVADFYTIEGLSETNDLILRMRANLVRDVSVGFSGGTARCDICGNDFWECRHFPGMKYEEKKGNVVSNVLATFTIEDARLNEVSGVFDGSTPDAMILKAQRFAAAGLLNREQAEKISARYRITLPYRHTAAVIKEGESVMDGKQLGRLAEILGNAGLLPEDQRETLDVETGLGLVDKLALQNRELNSQAADGRQYREDCIASALAAGVRAYGNDFDKATYQGILVNAPIRTIKQFEADWSKVAKTELPTGRTSVDETTVVTEEIKVKPRVPDSAFA
jgi:hypothetical protein